MVASTTNGPVIMLDSVIIIWYHDNMIRTQISFDEGLYERAKQVAQWRGISLAELCRRGLAALIAEEPLGVPWMRHAGILDGSPDDSENVDEVVYGRIKP